MNKEIEGWNDYIVYDDGRVYSKRSQKFLKPNTDKSGYLYYVLSVKGMRKTVKAHRLVAATFIDNPENKPTVNHKDGNRQNNKVSNLEWATYYEQTHDDNTYPKILKTCMNRDFKAMGSIRNFGRKAITVFKDGKSVGTYSTLKEASEKIGVNTGKLSEVANGKRKTTGGYTAKWASEIEEFPIAVTKLRFPEV